jgi:hypothetical protein
LLNDKRERDGTFWKRERGIADCNTPISLIPFLYFIQLLATLAPIYFSSSFFQVFGDFLGKERFFSLFLERGLSFRTIFKCKVSCVSLGKTLFIFFGTLGPTPLAGVGNIHYYFNLL